MDTDRVPSPDNPKNVPWNPQNRPLPPLIFDLENRQNRPSKTSKIGSKSGRNRGRQEGLRRSKMRVRAGPPRAKISRNLRNFAPGAGGRPGRPKNCKKCRFSKKPRFSCILSISRKSAKIGPVISSGAYRTNPKKCENLRFSMQKLDRNSGSLENRARHPPSPEFAKSQKNPGAARVRKNDPFFPGRKTRCFCSGRTFLAVLGITPE